MLCKYRYIYIGFEGKQHSQLFHGNTKRRIVKNSKKKNSIQHRELIIADVNKFERAIEFRHRFVRDHTRQGGEHCNLWLIYYGMAGGQ